MAVLEVRRRTNTGNLKDADLLAAAEPAIRQAHAEIRDEIERNLSGGMINARGGAGSSGREPINDWYDLTVEEGDRSLTIQVTVKEGIPSLLHTGVPHSWSIKAVKANALHWQDESGDDAFAKEVTHPAMAPRPFAEEPVRRIARKIPERVRQAVRRRLGG